jgi:hypothetical protein
MDIKGFFAPTYKKLGWFFLVLFIAHLYSNVIMPFVPTSILQQFINFILNPLTILLVQSPGIEANLAIPIAITINAMWQYFLASLIVKEIGKD